MGYYKTNDQKTALSISISISDRTGTMIIAFFILLIGGIFLIGSLHRPGAEATEASRLGDTYGIYVQPNSTESELNNQMEH